MNNYDKVRHQSKSRILLELIRQYDKPEEEAKMIDEAKQRSVLLIEKRFTRSDVNRIYIFPRKVEAEDNVQLHKPSIRNIDFIGYNTQRINLNTTRPLSTSKGNSAERIRNISCLKNEHILVQLKKAQESLRQNQQINSVKRSNQANQLLKDNNSTICQELLKKIYTQNPKSSQLTKVTSASNLRSTDLYKNIENICKTNKPQSKSPSNLLPQYFKKQNSSIFLKDNFIKIQNESLGYSPQAKYQTSFTSRQNNKTMLNIQKQQLTMLSCKSFDTKVGKLNQSPQIIQSPPYLINDKSQYKTSQTRHLTQFLKNMTQGK